MKKTINLLILLLALFAFSCSKDDGTPNFEPPKPDEEEPTEPDDEVEPYIEIRDVSIVPMDDGEIKIQVSPQIKNATIHSFSMILKDHPSEFIPVDFVLNESLDTLFVEEEDDSYDFELSDNGNRDEDSKSGSFTYTFSTDYWEGGNYDIEFIARATPKEGDTGELMVAKSEFRLEIEEELSGTWIKIYNFRTKQVDKGKVKVMFQARSFNVPIGSFNIQLMEYPGDDIPEVFKSHASALYVLEDGTANIPDNGELDEDPRVKHFAYTFDMNDWTDGDHKITFVASLRPNDGDWVAGKVEDVVFNKNMFP